MRVEKRGCARVFVYMRNFQYRYTENIIPILPVYRRLFSLEISEENISIHENKGTVYKNNDRIKSGPRRFRNFESYIPFILKYKKHRLCGVVKLWKNSGIS